MNLDQVRMFIYRYLADEGVPPTYAHIAERFDVSPEVARQSIADLGKRKMVVVRREAPKVWMAGPFSAVPTPFRVHGEHASYWANCAWDMLGIPAFLSESVRVEATCADCNTVVKLEIDSATGPRSDAGLVHILLPAAEWYADIGFT